MTMGNAPRVSVAMATYNGGKYIAEQLQSILDQTRPVDEIVISDDGSTDDTLEVARRVLEQNCTSWKIVKNRHSRGYPSNFSTAMEETSGTIVFLSDQDDIWLPEKVEAILDVFSDPKIELVVHDAHILRGDRKEKISDVLASRGVPAHANFYGCMMAVRRSLLDMALPFPGNAVGHDHLLRYCADARGSGHYHQFPLMYYRRHDHNLSQIMFRKTNRKVGLLQRNFDYHWLKDRVIHSTVFLNLLESRRQSGITMVHPEVRASLEKRNAIFALRYSTVFQGHALSPLLHWRDYRRLGISSSAWAKDVVSALLRLHRRYET